VNASLSRALAEWNADPRSSSSRSYEQPARSESASTWDIKGRLKRRKRLILGVATLAMARATLAIFMMPRNYVAISAVIFRGDRPDVIRLVDSQRGTSIGSDTLASEIELLTSEELLTTVVDELNLVADPDFNAAAAYETGFALPHKIAEFVAPVLSPMMREGQQLFARVQTKDNVQPTAAAAQKEVSATVMALKHRFTGWPVGVSRVIRISFSSRRAQTASLVANTVANVYVDRLLADKTKATQGAHTWINQRLKELRERASKFAQVYERFRFDNGLARGKDSTITQEQITQVSSELTQAWKRSAEAQAIFAQTCSGEAVDLDNRLIT